MWPDSKLLAGGLDCGAGKRVAVHSRFNLLAFEILRLQVWRFR